MAKLEYLEILKQGAEVWNLWRKRHAADSPEFGRANLREANLREANLSGANLSGANLSGADLRGTDLGGADLSGANLREANLGGANLTEANLRGADFRGADLTEANLSGANLRDADLTAANLSGADFRGANLRDADLTAANLSGAGLLGADLTGATLPLRDRASSGAPPRARPSAPTSPSPRAPASAPSPSGAYPKLSWNRVWRLLRNRMTGAGAAASAPAELPPLGPPLEDVQLGAASPAAVRPAREFTARFVAYIEETAPEVEAVLHKLSPRSTVHLGLRSCRWADGTRVTVALEGSNLVVEQSRQTFEWNRKWHLVEFDVQVPTDAPEGTVVLKFDVSIADTRVARLRLDLDIDSGAPLKCAERVSSGRPVRSAFASYASEDRKRVLDRIAALRNHAGLDVFLDCLSLHPGEKWKPKLEREIDERDLFLLFWSQAAKDSQWVDWEWRSALERKDEETLELHPLHPVDKAPPPPELAHLHFGDPLMTLREYEARES